jgi:hypothetical protein
MSAGADWVAKNNRVVLDFDGLNDYINCGNSLAHQFSDTDNFSVSCWFNRRTSATKTALISCINNSDQGWALSPTGVGTISFPADSAGASVSISTNITYHVAAVNRNGLRELYLNGAIGGSSSSGTITAASTTTAIGRYYGLLSGSLFSGWIDDVRIYNRALTPVEISLLASEPGIGLRPKRVSVYCDDAISSRRRKILTGLT